MDRFSRVTHEVSIFSWLNVDVLTLNSQLHLHVHECLIVWGWNVFVVDEVIFLRKTAEVKLQIWYMNVLTTAFMKLEWG